jgi:sialidase-1
VNLSPAPGWGSAQQVWDPVGQRAILQFGLSAQLYTTTGGCDAQPGTATGNSDNNGTFQLVSTDHGKTYGEFQDLQRTYLPKLDRCMAMTSGTGVRMRDDGPYAGRLLTTVVHNSYKGDVVLWSDDHGKTYNYSTDLLVAGVDEGQLAQLPNGSLVNLMRNCWHGTTKQCAQSVSGQAEFPSDSNLLSYSISTSGGQSWGPIQLQKELPTPVCKSSIIGFNGTLFFVGPWSESSRTNVTVAASLDQGLTWPHRLQLVNGLSGYTSV